MRFSSKKNIALALQGGGSHGAFTWGVLDHLLQQPKLNFEAVSGTSAGSMNAVLLAYGMTLGGREKARELLSDFWQGVGHNIPFSSSKARLAENLTIENADGSPLLSSFLAFSRFFSPYQFNPFDLNPLRDLLAELIDFKRLRCQCRIKLFIAATQVRTGKLRLFETHELNIDALLASACLPLLHHTIEIDGEPYWDGGFSANPAIFPLLQQCRAKDIVTVLLNPLQRSDYPKTADAIGHRLSELGFNATYLREMSALAHAKLDAEEQLLAFSQEKRRLREARFHILAEQELMEQLSANSKLNTEHSFLSILRDQGRLCAQDWLQRDAKGQAALSARELVQQFG